VDEFLDSQPRPPRDESQVIAKVNYTHAALVDTIIAHPQISQKDLAAHFGFTQGWLSRILRSDAVREMIAARKAELVDPTIIASIEQNMEALAQRSMDVLMEKLDLPNASPDIAVKALEITSRALGYGAQKSGVNIQQNFVVAMPPKSVDGAAWVSDHSPRILNIEPSQP
jgi:DNA-binding MarR family transcriptional regulator